ncbi:MAG: hypothetical protein CBC48_14640 [bacterium TMED88]|nr:MAG: hypothetical protein CBC48_14640 [bacterium TMED88]
MARFMLAALKISMKRLANMKLNLQPQPQHLNQHQHQPLNQLQPLKLDFHHYMTQEGLTETSLQIKAIMHGTNS